MSVNDLVDIDWYSTFLSLYIFQEIPRRGAHVDFAVQEISVRFPDKKISISFYSLYIFSFVFQWNCRVAQCRISVIFKCEFYIRDYNLVQFSLFQECHVHRKCTWWPWPHEGSRAALVDSWWGRWWKLFVGRQAMLNDNLNF